MSRRFRVRVGLAAVAALLPAGAAACAGDDELDVTGLEEQLEDELLPGIEVADADCPSGQTVAPGDRFTCEITIDGQTLDVRVTQGERGSVLLEQQQAVVTTATAAELVTKLLTDETGVAPTSVDCGAASALVVAVDATFDCTATNAEGTTLVVRATVQNIDGQLEPALV